MSELLTVNPAIPYVGKIPLEKLEPGKMCRIQGVTLPNTDRFNVNLQTGPNDKPRDDTALHISVRINQGYIARNSYVNGEWGSEEGSGSLPIGATQSFEILILIDAHDYKVAVNGQHFCEFKHRIPLEKVTHLLINGDVNITLISWEHSVPPQTDSAAERSSVNANQSPQFSSGQAFPPPNQSQGYYGPPPQYGPSQYGPPQYGPPPPPGHEQQSESAFGGFLAQAQEALVGAIKTGAAEKLLSGLLSTGDKQQQGYAPQNAQYGLYPQLPREDLPNQNIQPQQQPQNVPTRGPLETFLSGLLSNNQQQQQPNNYNIQPNFPPQQQPQQQPNNFNTQPNFPPQQQPQQQQQQQPPDVSYGQYPGPPQGPPPAPQQGRGPLESLLSGILPSGQQTQPQQSYGHSQQQGQGGGFGDMGGILSSLAGQILHNPQGGNRQ